MAQIVIAAAGAAAGFMIGGPTGAQVGWMAGSMLGSLVAPTKVQGAQQQLMDLRITGTDYGQPIPYARGSVRVAGQMWWNTDRRPTTTTSTSGGGGKGGGPEASSSTTTYDMDCLIGLLEKEIVGIRRIWNNGDLVYTAAGDATSGSLDASANTDKWTRLTVYTGAADQLPDPTYEAAVTTALAPAYRGRSYVFIEGLQLGTSGAVPNLTFDVVVDGSSAPYSGSFGTLDSSKKSANVELSGGDLTSASIAGAPSLTYFSVDGQPAKSSGKWYVEAELKADPTGSFVAVSLMPDGSVPADGDIPGGGGSGTAGYTVDAIAGNIWHGGTVTTGYSPGFYYLLPFWIGMYFDADNGTVGWIINGVDYGIAFYGLSGAFVPCITGMKGSGTPSGIDATINFGGSAWHTDPPAGYYGWNDTDASLVVSASPPDLDDVVSDLCLRAGLDASQIDVTGLASITRKVESMAISQIAPTRQALELLMSAFFFGMTLSDKLYFIPRGGSSVASIPYEDLGAHFVGSEQQPEPLELLQANDLEIPAQVALTYVNIDDDYQSDTQYSDRLISAASGTVSAVQMALGMTPAEAKAIADTLLLDQAASMLTTTISLLGDYAALEPTDPVTITDKDGTEYRMRLIKRTDSYPLLAFDAVLDDVSVLTSQGITSADYSSSTVVAAAVDTSMELMDIPILRDADNDAGFYVATKGSGTPYAGSAVYGSADDVDYTLQATVSESAVFGTCSTTLGDWTGPRIFDERNSVTVNVGSATLASSTRSAILNSLSVNAMLVGSEIIQFRTATLVSAGVYTLTGLLRGCRGTEWAMTGHAASERCVLLRTAGLRRIALANSDIGLSRYYKGVTIGRALSTATAEAFTDNAVGLKPFSPILLKAARDGSNNITFTWQRRTRLSVRMIGALGISVPLGEDAEAYELDVYADGTYTTVVRTISASAETASYTAAQQTADGLTPGDPVNCKLYQISAYAGRGYALEKAA